MKNNLLIRQMRLLRLLYYTCGYKGRTGVMMMTGCGRQLKENDLLVINGNE